MAWDARSGLKRHCLTDQLTGEDVGMAWDARSGLKPVLL